MQAAKTTFPTNKAVLLDRDGVINRERGEYTFRIEDFEILPDVPQALRLLKEAGFLLIVITNQAGIAKKLYDRAMLAELHRYMRRQLPELDGVYYSPWHESVTQSLGRKPGTLLFERALANYKLDPASSWMVGDKARDLIPARTLGLHTALLHESTADVAPELYDLHGKSLLEIANAIMKN